MAKNPGARHMGLIPGSGRSPAGRNSNPLQYSCLENSTDRGICGLQSMGSQRVGHDLVTKRQFNVLILKGERQTQ